MTHNDLLAAIEALPKEVQFAFATTVLDRLGAEGPLRIGSSEVGRFVI